MPWQCEKVHEPALAAARTAEEYALHQAALEWSLAKLIILQREFGGIRTLWYMPSPPGDVAAVCAEAHPHQPQVFDNNPCYELRGTLQWAGV